MSIIRRRKSPGFSNISRKSIRKNPVKPTEKKVKPQKLVKKVTLRKVDSKKPEDCAYYKTRIEELEKEVLRLKKELSKFVKPNRFSGISDDATRILLSKMDIRSVFNLCSVDKNMSDNVCNEGFWKRLVITKYKDKMKEEKNIKSWKLEAKHISEYEIPIYENNNLALYNLTPTKMIVISTDKRDYLWPNELKSFVKRYNTVQKSDSDPRIRYNDNIKKKGQFFGKPGVYINKKEKEGSFTTNFILYNIRAAIDYS